MIPEYPVTEQQDKRVKHVERITSAVNNLNDILSDFLSLSKIEEGKVIANIKLINLKNLVAEIINEMKGICKNNQEIHSTYEGHEEIALDPKLTKNIIINLIANAIKFSGENQNIYLDIIIDSNEIKIIVRDEGIGISPDDQKHLFERFFRGKNATNIQGTGLGLNIVLKYLELMNGMIEMHSVLDEGSTFVITLPNDLITQK